MELTMKPRQQGHAEFRIDDVLAAADAHGARESLAPVLDAARRFDMRIVVGFCQDTRQHIVRIEGDLYALLAMAAESEQQRW